VSLKQLEVYSVSLRPLATFCQVLVVAVNDPGWTRRRWLGDGAHTCLGGPSQTTTTRLVHPTTINATSPTLSHTSHRVQQ
jgi:hypothetical protein